MKLLILTIGDISTPSSRLRWYNYIDTFKENGYFVTIQKYTKKLILTTQFDVCVVQKILLDKYKIKYIKKYCQRIVFDVDDLIWKTHPINFLNSKALIYSLFLTYFRLINLNRFDAIIVSNRYLMNKLKKFNKFIHIIPTSPSDWHDKMDELPQDLQFKIAGKKVLGWTGSKENIFYLYKIRKELTRFLLNNSDWVLIVISNGIFSIDNCEVNNKIINIRWTLEIENTVMPMFDIGIMPNSKTSWEKGKAAFKLIYYMKNSVAGVATDFGFQKEFITNYKNGILVKNNKWCDNLSKLANNDDLRGNIAKEGRKTFVELFSKEVIWNKYFNFFNLLIGSN